MDELERLKNKALQGDEITEDEAAKLYKIGRERPVFLMAYASEIRSISRDKRSLSVRL
jgi:hypothetical protein